MQFLLLLIALCLFGPFILGMVGLWLLIMIFVAGAMVVILSIDRLAGLKATMETREAAITVLGGWTFYAWLLSFGWTVMNRADGIGSLTYVGTVTGFCCGLAHAMILLSIGHSRANKPTGTTDSTARRCDAKGRFLRQEPANGPLSKT